MKGVLAALKLGYRQKKTKVYVSNHTKNKNFLRFLITQGVIASFKNTPTYFIVYLKKPFFATFNYKVLKPSTKKIAYRYVNLRALLLKSPLLLCIINTTKGLKTLSECFQQKIGGEVLCILTIN